MTTLAKPLIRAPRIGAVAYLERLARHIASRPKNRSLTPLAHLDEHILRDIGMNEDARFVLRARREAELALLRQRSGAGPFFVPPA